MQYRRNAVGGRKSPLPEGAGKTQLCFMQKTVVFSPKHSCVYPTNTVVFCSKDNCVFPQRQLCFSMGTTVFSQRDNCVLPRGQLYLAEKRGMSRPEDTCKPWRLCLSLTHTFLIISSPSCPMTGCIPPAPRSFPTCRLRGKRSLSAGKQPGRDGRRGFPYTWHAVPRRRRRCSPTLREG